jgi:hypothetical protein
MLKHPLPAVLAAAALALPALSRAALPEFIQPPAQSLRQQVLLDAGETSYGAIGALYEASLSPANSVEAGVNFTGNGLPSDYFSASGVKAGFHWWIPQDFWPHPQARLLGWFAGPEIQADFVSWHYQYTGSGRDSYGTFFGGGAEGGYQWIFHPGLTARLYAEADYLAGNLDGLPGAPGVGYGGLAVGGHAAVGWSF